MFSNNVINRCIEKTWRSFSPAYGGKIAVNWHMSNNFGDLLSVYIAKKLSGMDVANVAAKSSYLHYQIIGSILSLANDKSFVWGTGFANRTDSFARMPRKIHMVRGEYSLERCRKLGLKDGVPIGDPGYIISRLYWPQEIKKKYSLGVIPHWVDYEFCKKLFENQEDTLVINLLNPNVEEVIDEILQCRQCISSSLHGLVVAHSYDIPALQVTFSDTILKTGLKEYELAGDGIKFLDYFSSVGITEYLPTEITHLDIVKEILEDIPQDCGNKNQVDKIISACPFLKVNIDLR